MQNLPAELHAAFEHRLDRARIPPSWRPAYYRWINFDLLFWQKFGYPAAAPAAPGLLLTKLTDKSYSIDDRHRPRVLFLLLISFLLADISVPVLFRIVNRCSHSISDQIPLSTLILDQLMLI